MIIVIAWLVVEQEPIGTWRQDLGERPKMKEVVRARTAIWLNDGNIEDVRNAKAFAATEGAQVFTYPTNDPDPLTRAKAECIHSYKRKEKGPSISARA